MFLATTAQFLRLEGVLGLELRSTMLRDISFRHCGVAICVSYREGHTNGAGILLTSEDGAQMQNPRCQGRIETNTKIVDDSGNVSQVKCDSEAAPDEVEGDV